MIIEDYHYTLFKKRGSDRTHEIFYYAFYDENGKRCKRSTACTTERNARAYVNKLIATGKFREAPIICNLTFKEFAQRYHFWEWGLCPYVTNVLKRGGHFSKDLCRGNRDSMNKHIMPTFGNIKLRQITKSMINNWLVCLPEASSISNSTANKMRIILYHMLEVSADMNLINREICRKDNWVAPLPANNKSRPAFTQEQIDKLFSSKWENEFSYIACKLAAFTGMRLGEVRALTSEQIHPNYIDVSASWNDGEGRKCTKSSKSRVVPIAPQIYDMLMSIAPASGLLFTLNGTTPINDDIITIPLRKKMEELNIEHKKTATQTALTFHCFRHFFNTRLVANAFDGNIVRAVIGHEDEAMTNNYTHLELNDMESVVQLQQKLMKQKTIV